MIKAVVLHNYVVPHSFPLLRELAKKKDLDLEVFYMAESARNRRWRLAVKTPGFKYKVLPNFQLSYFTKDLFAYIINPTIIKELVQSKYDIVISDGWLDFSCQASFFQTKVQKKKFILWSESTHNEPSLRRTLSLPLIKMIVRGADAYLARSIKAKKYLVALGASPHKIFMAPCVIDIDFFSARSKISLREKELLKQKLGINSDSPVILYVGQLIERKGIFYLLEAFRRIQKKTKNKMTLLVQGYGPLKNKLLDKCSRQGIKNVVFSDHVEMEEIPKVYALGDIFVLPSYEETWGRVINEAIACGLPVITTRKVGAAGDLVKDGINGYVVKERNVAALQKAVETLLFDPILRKKMAREGLKISEKLYTPRFAAQGVYQAIKFVSREKKENKNV